MGNRVTKSKESYTEDGNINKDIEKKTIQEKDEYLNKDIEKKTIQELIKKFFDTWKKKGLSDNKLRRFNANWFWNSNNDSKENKQEWTLYKPEENEIIEKGYIQKKSRVELKDYIIYFESMIQIHKEQQWRVRTIKREIETERFSDKLPEPKQTTVNTITNMKHPEILINNLQKCSDIYNFIVKNVPFKNNDELILLKKNIQIILGECKNIKNEEVLKKLKSMKSFEDFKKTCISIYTSDDLYRKVNCILRQGDSSSQEYLNYMSFLNFILREDRGLKRWDKTVYRGCNLNVKDVEKYRQIWKSDYPGFQWNSFVSSTKNKKVANMFSNNVLFVIDFYENTFGIDIQDYSLIPDEEEVLIPASSVFQIENISENDDLIEIKLIKIDSKFSKYLSKGKNLSKSELIFGLSNQEDFLKIDKNLIPERIYNELRFLYKDRSLNFKFYLEDLRIKFLFKGPIDTPYQDGMFQLDMEFVSEYPFKPPLCKFDTPIWHPNISSKSGIVCMDILKNQWSLCLTSEKLVYSTMSLLSEPNFSDPFDIIVANSYHSDPSNYEKIVKNWVEKYANIEDFI